MEPIVLCKSIEKKLQGGKQKKGDTDNGILKHTGHCVTDYQFLY